MQKYVQSGSGILVPRSSSDGLINIASGLGTSKTKRSHNRFAYSDIGDWSQLDAAYQTNWIARAIVDEWAADAVREWRTINSQWSEEIQKHEEYFCLQQSVEEAIAWSRLYGGAGIVMLTNQDLEQPLNVERIKKGDLQSIVVFDRHDLTGDGSVNNYDMLKSNYMKYDYYRVNGGSQRIHYSHIAFFNGARLPRRQAIINQGWGDSELRRCIEEVADMVASKDGIAELMQEANIDVITNENLMEYIESGCDDIVKNRYELFSLMKSNINMALLDGKEKLDRLTLNLSGVSGVLEQFMVWISGAARMPMTKIFGTSAKGLNATGEGDKANYYDAIRSKQTGDISRSMSVIDQVLVRSAVGNMPEDYSFTWNPLEQLDGVQVAQEQLLQAQKNIIYIDANIIQRSQVMRNLQSNEEYQYDGEYIDKLEEYENASIFDFDEPEYSLEKDVPVDSTVVNSALDSVYTVDYIRHEANKWNVYSNSGKLLGTHNTQEEAEAQLLAVEAHKKD